MKRTIITIDREKCTGCGLCIPNCPEGAIKIIDGKARLVNDSRCDGLGACLGHCPEGAIAIEERDAQDYDERAVMAAIAGQGVAVIRAHLAHLKAHGQDAYYEEAIRYLEESGIPVPEAEKAVAGGNHASGGCPGSRSFSFGRSETAAAEDGKRPSRLTHWPVQMHLIAPSAPHYEQSRFLLAADCVAYALGDFHKEYLKGSTLGIACPKLDDEKEVYIEKLRVLIDEARIKKLTVMIMEVPCCAGLLQLAREAAARAKRKVPIECLVAGIDGTVKESEFAGQE